MCASEVVNGKLTSLLFQPEAFGAGEGGPNTSVGGVASRLSVRDAESVPPADVAVHVNVVPALSVDSMGSSQPSVERIGEIGSSTDQSMRTSLVYQPLFPCGDGRLEPIVGGYRSMLKGGDVYVVLLPARSVTTNCPVTPVPSWLMISGFSLLVVYTPESASFALNVIATFILFQPWSSGKAMTSTAVTVGATVSRRIVTERVAVPPLDVAEQVNVRRQCLQ